MNVIFSRPPHSFRHQYYAASIMLMAINIAVLCAPADSKIDNANLLSSKENFEQRMQDEIQKNTAGMNLAKTPCLEARAWCYYQLGKFDKAEADYTQAINRIESKDAGFITKSIAHSAYFGRASSLMALEKFEAALSDLGHEQIEIRATNLTDTRFRNLLQSEIEANRSLHSANPLKSLRMLAWYHLLLGEYDYAITEFSQAINIGKAKGDAIDDLYFGRGSAHRAIEKYDQAMEDYLAAQKSQVEFMTNGMNNLAWLFIVIGTVLLAFSVTPLLKKTSTITGEY